MHPTIPKVSHNALSCLLHSKLLCMQTFLGKGLFLSGRTTVWTKITRLEQGSLEWTTQVQDWRIKNRTCSQFIGLMQALLMRFDLLQYCAKEDYKYYQKSELWFSVDAVFMFKFTMKVSPFFYQFFMGSSSGPVFEKLSISGQEHFYFETFVF